MNTTTTIPLACVNGVALHEADELLDDETLRQRACTELLRQAAERAGLLGTSAPRAGPRPGPPPGGGKELGSGPSFLEAADTGDAIEALLERELNVPEPGDEALRRHYEAHRASYAQGEKLQMRHVLFAVTPGVDVQALRRHAEGVLLELRCAEPGSDAFARAAEAWSNCPSREAGGELGWLTREDCAPEFAREVFAADTTQAIGVLPRLVHSRFGLHVVEVRAREAGTVPAFDEVRGAVALALKQQAWVNALRQYLQVLAGEAELEGVSLQAAETPLVQ